MSAFYYLNCKETRFVDLAEGNDWEGIVCPKDPGHQRAGKRITELHIDIESNRVVDFSSTFLSYVVITDRALRAMEREGLTGFRVKPVVVHSIPNEMDSSAVPKLWEFIVTGWAGMARPESGIERTHYCEMCKSVKYSGLNDAQRLIDETQWDGSDFFIVWPMPKFIFITKRVADCMREHRLTGVVIKKVRELSGIGRDGFSPGRLSRWMPETRARELGKAAGIVEI